MAVYAIGDVQGCYDELARLLERVTFDPAADRLWLTGDLVNRGPASLAVLRLVQSLGERATVVLGNHDLHLLACRHVAGHRPRRRDTLDEILRAPDGDALMDWLRHRPLLHREAGLPFVLVHAGIHPVWTVAEAADRAREIEHALRAADFATLLADMYGSTPDQWRDDLAGIARRRFIINAFTRMRYLTGDGALDLAHKEGTVEPGAGLTPWFAHPARRPEAVRVVFGHWSTLRLDAGARVRFGVEPLDTGAVWGGQLTALRLEDGARLSVASGVQAPGGD